MTQGSGLLDAHAIPKALRSGEITAADTTRAHLERIRAVDGGIHAYVDVWEDHAMERAASIDERVRRGEDPGPLAGVPIALKDNFCTLTGRTECCSRILEGYESPYNATVVDRLLDAGAVLLGKLNMDEFAMGSSTENSVRGLTRNPWDGECVAGGSSGGGAAAVTTFQAAAALGSDTGGSVRQPAAFCGCIGLKPTYGRVSRYGLVAFASSLDQIGPLTRTVEDAALLLKVISGRDERDATSADVPVPDYNATLKDGVKGLTLGIPKEYFTAALGEEMHQKVQTAVDVLQKQGAKIIDVSLPHTDYGIAVYYIICTAEASANLARFDGVRYGFRGGAPKNIQEMYTQTKSEGFGLEVQRRIMLGTYVLSSGYYDAYYLKAQKVRTLIRKDFDEALKLCDVLVTPTTPTPAFKIGAKIDDPLQMYLNDVYTSTLNLAGFPGISIPCGFSDSGLPTGLQLLGRPFEEATLLRVAYAYEQNRGFDMGLPSLP